MTIRKLLNYWFGKKRSGLYACLGLAAAASYLAGNMLPASKAGALPPVLKRIGFLSFLGVILAFFIHLNLHAVHRFLEQFKDTDRLPQKQIGLVNSFCITVFLTLALALLPGTAFCLEPLWHAIGAWLSGRTDLNKALSPALPMETQPINTPDPSALLGEARPTLPWIALLDKLLRTAGALILGFLMILAVRRLLLAIWAWITRPRHFDGDEKIYLTPTLSLFASLKPGKDKKGKGSRLSYDKRIRQKYRRKILSLSAKKKRSPAQSASPSELELAVGLNNPILHQLYEKARYSENGCDKTDWQLLSERQDSDTWDGKSYLRSLNLCTDSDSSSD